MSPSVAFLRWPTCAALFGLMAVCSTIDFSLGGPRRGVRCREPSPRGGRPVEEQVEIAARGRLHARDAGDRTEVGRKFLAMTRGAFRRRRASSKATGMARSPSARRGGVSMTMAGWSPVSSPKAAVRAAPSARLTSACTGRIMRAFIVRALRTGTNRARAASARGSARRSRVPWRRPFAGKRPEER